MKYTYTSKSIKEIKKLPKEALKKICKLQMEIEKAKNLKEIRNLAPIKTYKNLYRIKRQPYRIIARVEENTLIILSISKRNDRTYKSP